MDASGYTVPPGAVELHVALHLSDRDTWAELCRFERAKGRRGWRKRAAKEFAASALAWNEVLCEYPPDHLAPAGPFAGAG